MNDKRNEFLTKLANLLDEYNVDIEFVCSVMNNKVYYSEKEQKRITRRMFVLNSLK